MDGKQNALFVSIFQIATQGDHNIIENINKLIKEFFFFSTYFIAILKIKKCLQDSQCTILLNYLITLAKLHIWQSRKQDKIPECEVFLKQVDVKYRTEKYIAVKNNTQQKFQAKWLLYKWHLYIINHSLQI